MVQPVTPPTPEQIVAALLAYDVALHNNERPTLPDRMAAMRAAIEAAIKQKG